MERFLQRNRLECTLIDREAGIDNKYNAFLKIYEEGVSKHIPKQTKQFVSKKDWFNNRCRIAKENRDQAWNIARKRKKH